MSCLRSGCVTYDVYSDISVFAVGLCLAQGDFNLKTFQLFARCKFVFQANRHGLQWDSNIKVSVYEGSYTE